MLNRNSVFKTFFLIYINLLVVHQAAAQYEYLATLNYSNLSLSRIANITGVTWITNNSTYDKNNRRFFFQGNATRVTPWNLYTIDAVTGATLFNPACPSSSIGGQIYGLQYDNTNNVLYVLHQIAGTTYFSSVDPTTASIIHITPIPNYIGYSQSTFDENDQFYIVSNGNDLVVIDVVKGVIINNLPNANLNDLVFDNLTRKLYGIKYGWQFDSVSLSTGYVNFISNLPPLSLPQSYAYTIDEKSGKFIFLGADPPSAACISNYLYVLDINTGSVISKTMYPYAQNLASATDENFIDFSFDNNTETLYGLNWYPPPILIAPTIAVGVSANPVCGGIPIQFTATETGLSKPGYLWQLNGTTVGTNSPTYTNNNPATGDTVICFLADLTPCNSTPTVNSKPIIMTVDTAPPYPVTITSSVNNVCRGDTILFNATAAGAGANPTYQWKINGVATGSGKDTLSCSGLQNGDSVYCLVTGDSACSLPNESNKVVAIIMATPSVFVGNDTVISPGQTILLDPTITGSVVSYQWSPTIYLNNPLVKNPFADPAATTSYQLTVTGDDGCTASGKITITINYSLKMPNAFSPNGDGLNDVFRIPSQTSQKIISFSVFNRWGQRIFNTENSSSGWDGNFGNQAQPPDTYVWQLKYLDLPSGKVVTASGTVLLVR
jgi:gliding motility-associated-like protein